MLIHCPEDDIRNPRGAMEASCAGCETNLFSLKSTQKLLDPWIIVTHPTIIIKEQRDGVVVDICQKDGRDEVEKEVDIC